MVSSDSEATTATSEGQPIPGQPATDACPMCKGVGYYVLDVPVNNPNFGVLMTCECKQQEKEKRKFAEMRRLSNLRDLEDKTFQTFDQFVPGVKRAFARAYAYAQNPQGWLILFGNYGCGKTHLAAAVANVALQRDRVVLFTIVPDLLDHLRSTFGPNSDVGYDVRFETIREVPLLVLDDLGTENTTPWAREKLYQIMNHRYNRKLPTVITSNRAPNAIEPRIYSRLSDRSLCGEIIMIDADDYRPRTAEQRVRRRKNTS